VLTFPRLTHAAHRPFAMVLCQAAQTSVGYDSAPGSPSPWQSSAGRSSSPCQRSWPAISGATPSARTWVPASTGAPRSRAARPGTTNERAASASACGFCPWSRVWPQVGCSRAGTGLDSPTTTSRHEHLRPGRPSHPCRSPGVPRRYRRLGHSPSPHRALGRRHGTGCGSSSVGFIVVTAIALDAMPGVFAYRFSSRDTP
jgi:hypothetical protein